LSYTNYPNDLFSLYTSVVPVGHTLVFTKTVGGIPAQYEEWDYIGGWITSGGNSLETAFAFDVLTSNGTAPVADYTVTSGSVCVGGQFEVDGSISTGTIDTYNWSLSDYPYTGNYVVFDGAVTDVISPTVATGSQQAIWLITYGACTYDIVGYLVDVLPAV